MNKKIFFSALLLCIATYSLQAQTLSQRLNQAMEKKRVGTYFEGASPFFNDVASNSNEFLQSLEKYRQDSSASVRDFTCELYAMVQEKAKDNQSKQLAIENLCTFLSDSVQRVRSTAAVALEEIPKGQFSDKAKQSILESLTAYGELDEDQILLAGYLVLNNVINDLQRIKGDPLQENRIRWCAYLALARMGDEGSLDFILNATQKQGINDRVVYNYFPDLIYTRQRKAFDYLVQELFSNVKNCNSPNPNISKEMVCGYRIMEMLAPVVKDFPLSVTASGTIDAKNYDKALETSRKWFEKHKTDYVILDERF